MSLIKYRDIIHKHSSSSIDKQKQQNNYQTLSLNRGQSKSNVVYQDENNPQLNSAFDKLIERYAPEVSIYLFVKREEFLNLVLFHQT